MSDTGCASRPKYLIVLVMDVDQDEVWDLSDTEVVTKYKAAAEIANAVLAKVVKLCVPGKDIFEICQEGDAAIEEACKPLFKQVKIKGIAFPTSISVNNCAGHYSPLKGESTTLKDGDLAKIDLGVHIDGLMALGAHTTIVSDGPLAKPVTGRHADAICAAHVAGEAALRLLRPGNKSSQVMEAVQGVAKAFNCTPVEGVVSHEIGRFDIEGEKVIHQQPREGQKVEDVTFEENEVYVIDILMSTGEGKVKESEVRTTIYRREMDVNYKLKMKASRYLFNEIEKKYSSLPFSLRAFDEQRGRLGITECSNHGLVTPYPVLYEKEGEFIAQFKFTVLILPSVIDRLVGHALPYVSSQHKVTDNKINAVLAMGVKRSSKKKKKKKGGAAAATASDAMQVDN